MLRAKWLPVIRQKVGERDFREQLERVSVSRVRSKFPQHKIVFHYQLVEVF